MSQWRSQLVNTNQKPSRNKWENCTENWPSSRHWDQDELPQWFPGSYCQCTSLSKRHCTTVFSNLDCSKHWPLYARSEHEGSKLSGEIRMLWKTSRCQLITCRWHDVQDTRSIACLLQYIFIETLFFCSQVKRSSFDIATQNFKTIECLQGCQNPESNKVAKASLNIRLFKSWKMNTGYHKSQSNKERKAYSHMDGFKVLHFKSFVDLARNKLNMYNTTNYRPNWMKET